MFNTINNISIYDKPILQKKYKRIKNILKRWNYIKNNLEESHLILLKNKIIKTLLEKNIHDYIVSDPNKNKEIIKLLKETKIIWE